MPEKTPNRTKTTAKSSFLRSNTQKAQTKGQKIG
jgi:hypothetical protein